MKIIQNESSGTISCELDRKINREREGEGDRERVNKREREKGKRERGEREGNLFGWFLNVLVNI